MLDHDSFSVFTFFFTRLFRLESRNPSSPVRYENVIEPELKNRSKFQSSGVETDIQNEIST